VPVSIRAHLAAPLYRNAYFLIVGAVVASVAGFLFWALAARRYSSHVVGLNSAAVSAMIFVSGVSQLGLNAVLVRYLPGAGTSTRRFVLVSYGVAGGTSAAFGLVAAVTSGGWAPILEFLGSDPRWLAMFVIATVAWTIFSLQDSVMTGLRQTHWVPIENSLFSAAKVVILVAVVGLAPRAGVFIAWNLPVLLSLVPVNLLIFRRLIPLHVERVDAEAPAFAAPVRFAAGNYAGSLFFLGSTTLLPIIVGNEAGASATAFFFVPWTIATALQLVALYMTTSLTVEVAFDEARLAEYCRHILMQTLRLVVPVSLFLILAAPYVLRLFGDAYAREGAAVLRWLVLASIPNVVVVLGLSVARLQHSGRQVLVIQALLCALTLGLTVALLPPLGIEGVGIAFLASQTAVAAWLLIGILRPVLLGPSHARRLAQPSGEGGGA